MWSLIASAGSSVSGLIMLLLVVAGLVGSGAYVEHQVDEGTIQKMDASYAAAQASAVAASAALQKQVDDQALAAAQQETLAQAAQTASLQQELSNVHTQAPVLTKAIPCVPLALIQLLDAAVLRVPASSLAFPAGKSASSCSAITADELASSVVSNYSASNANAEQLNALIALLKKQQLPEKK